MRTGRPAAALRAQRQRFPTELGAERAAPRLYGYADYNPSVGAPANLRVYYPSLDGAPLCAPFLAGPGRFPLVIFLHGQCAAAEQHYTTWSLLPAGLARAGYVVAVPDLGDPSNPWDLTNPTYSLITDVIQWMHTSWSREMFLMPASTLGIVGHSYGALFGGRVAATYPASAYVSVGGVWSEWPGVPANPLNTLNVPKLLAVGTAAFAEGVNFNAAGQPKHRLTFPDGEHWDYVPSTVTACDAATSTPAGPCNLVGALAADLTAIFLSKHMPPEQANIGTIPDDLTLPAVTLTTEQQFFAGGHLMAFGLLGLPDPNPNQDCAFTLDWATPGGSGSRSLT